jgi:SAM-dependent methyltransferase
MALGLEEVRSWVRAGEEWWFDTTRGVRTAGNEGKPEAAQVVGEIRDSHIYAPVRVTNAHAALRDLPIRNLSEYTFVDVGSGKGRMLFVAAEYPFRKAVGVEFDRGLHELSVANIGRYKYRRRRCGEIESVHADAAGFEFPAGKLVIYMFNPFGPEVLGRMLDNLERSLEREPQHVVVVMLWPEYADVVARRGWLREWRKTRRHHIFETVL